MARWFGKALVCTLGLGSALSPTAAPGQVVRERDVKITGPRGNSLERDMKSIRGPGFVERQTTIHRPGGATFQSDRIIPTGGHGGGGPMAFGGPRGGWGPGWGGPREVIINNNRGLSAGNALLDFGLGAAVGGVVGGLVGRATAPTGPTIVAGPPAVLVPAAPVVVAQPVPPPVVQYVPAQPVQQVSTQVVPAEVHAAIQRLQSRHDSSRRDACLVLGRLGDDRAVPALFDRLKNDPSKDVRVAAANALGMIGDPKTTVILERAIVYDKKQEVRDAAAAALARVNQARTAAQTSSAVAEPVEAEAITQAQPLERVPPPPTPAIPR